MKMDNKKKDEPLQSGGHPGKDDKNAGSGAFNRGSQDDPQLNEGVADGTPHPEEISKEKENPKSGKVG